MRNLPSTRHRLHLGHEHWRVSGAKPNGTPVQLFLETREHVDQDELAKAGGTAMLS